MEVRQVCVRMCLCVFFAYIMRRVIHDKEGGEGKAALQKCRTFNALKCFATACDALQQKKQKESERAKDEVKALKQKQM